MPNYNCQKFIGQAIASVLNQSYVYWHLIIVDDASTDNSVEIIRSYEKVHERIELIALDKNLGTTAARNIGIEKSKGDLLAFMDSDDLWMKNRLEKTIDFLLHGDYDFVYSSYKRADENLAPLLSDYIVPEKLSFKDMLYHNPISIPSVLIRIGRIGKYYQPDVPKREDHALWLSILEDIEYAYGIPEPLFVYRIRKGSLSRNKLEMAKFQYLLYRRYLKLSFCESFYYTVHWAINGLKKYRKFFCYIFKRK